jgi:hypothetical protein
LVFNIATHPKLVSVIIYTCNASFWQWGLTLENVWNVLKQSAEKSLIWLFTLSDTQNQPKNERSIVVLTVGESAALFATA